MVGFTRRLLYPRGKSPVPIGKESGWAPEPVWTTWRKFLTLPGLELKFVTTAQVFLLELWEEQLSSLARTL
jgi:hypothetical protein